MKNINIQEFTKEMLGFNNKVKIVNKEEDSMYLSIMLGILTITTDFQQGNVVLTEIAAYELTDKVDDVGGLLTITLKGNSEELVYHCISNNGWNEVKEWFKSNQKVIIEGMIQGIAKETKKARF